MSIPERSSGASWTEAEERKLWGLFTELVEKMEGRSVAAVATRLEHLSSRPWKRRGWEARQ